MIDIQKINAVTDNPKFIEFAEFVISQAGDREFPNYREMDLMKIPSLVPNIWVLDFRNGLENGIPHIFTGTRIDEQYKRNLTGKTVESTYPGEDYEKLIAGCYHELFKQKRVAYTYRTTHFRDDFIDKFNLIETLVFPCSENDVDIDYSIGLATYSQVDFDIENIYTLL